MAATLISATAPPDPALARGVWQRLLVFVPGRRTWPGGARGGVGPATVMRYVTLHADGSWNQGSAPLSAMPRARAVELVFDSLDVYSATIDAPRLGEARLRQALPNLLEERMLGDPADYHFASMPSRAEANADATADVDTNRTLGHATADTAVAAAGLRLSVAAIDRTTLSRTLEACQLAQLQPRAAYSEIYTLPRPKSGVYGLRVDRDRGLLRTDLDQGFVFELDKSGASALDLARRQMGILQLRLYGAMAEPATLGIATQQSDCAVATDALTDAVNLLQGSYASAGGYGLVGRLLARLSRNGAWKAPAAWLGICAAIGIGGLNAYWFKLNAQVQGVRRDMQHTFRDAFPNEPPVDELAQARRNVAGLRARVGRASSDDFSALTAQAAQLLASAPVGVVAAIDYANGSYTLRFVPGSMEGAAMRNSLQARAMAQGLALRFGADGSAQLTPLASSEE